MENKKEYTLTLTQSEIDALPILFDMAEKMTWLLYSEDESVQSILGSQNNILSDKIDEYHKGDKNYGICATATTIEKKIQNILKTDYMNIETDDNIEMRKTLFGTMFYFLADNIARVYDLPNQEYESNDYNQFPIETFAKYLDTIKSEELGIQKIKEYIKVEKLNLESMIESMIKTKLDIKHLYKILMTQTKRFERALAFGDVTVSNYILVNSFDQLISNIRTYEIAYKDEIKMK